MCAILRKMHVKITINFNELHRFWIVLSCILTKVSLLYSKKKIGKTPPDKKPCHPIMIYDMGVASLDKSSPSQTVTFTSWLQFSPVTMPRILQEVLKAVIYF